MPADIDALQSMILRIIQISVGIGFMILVVMLVVGGIKFLTSGGEQKAVASAQQTLTWAILGIVMMAVAWIILRLITAFTGTDVTLFCLKIGGC